MKILDADFKECATCSKIPGSPLLCSACQHNRELVSDLQKSLSDSLFALNEISTHFPSISSALEIAKHDDPEGGSYWQHEIEAHKMNTDLILKVINEKV
jgi:hypothetical protein